MGVETVHALGIVDVDPRQQGYRAFLGLRLGELELLAHREVELLAHSEGRVEIRHRLLRNVGDVVAAERVELLLGEPEQRTPAEGDPTGRDDRLLGQEPEDRECGLRLAGAALAHQAEHLAAIDLEADALDDLARLVSRERVGDREVVHAEEGIGCRGLGFHVTLDRAPLASRAVARVTQGVAHGVGDQDEGEHGEDDRGGRPEDGQRRDVQGIEGVLEHPAPGRVLG